MTTKKEFQWEDSESVKTWLLGLDKNSKHDYNTYDSKMIEWREGRTPIKKKGKIVNYRNRKGRAQNHVRAELRKDEVIRNDSVQSL